MELLAIHYIEEAAPRHIITACDDTDTCPGCGAGYRVGLSACEYCKTPVKPACKPVGPPNESFWMFDVRRKTPSTSPQG